MLKWLWDSVLPLMGPYQFDAMPECSIVHALPWLRHAMTGSRTDKSRNKNALHIVLVGYPKAFHWLYTNTLLQKLQYLEITTFLLLWIMDCLSDWSRNARSPPLDIWRTSTRAQHSEFSCSF